MAIVWLRLAQQKHEPRFQSAAASSLRYVMAHQDIQTPCLDIRGGIKGSQPIWGRYAPLAYPNWATKFFIDPLTMAQTVAWADDWIMSGRSGYLSTVNVSILMMMACHPRLQGIVDRAALVVADGLPLVWVSRLLASPLPERVTGIDLIERLAAETTVADLRVYLLGASSEVVEAAAAQMQARHPRITVCGFADGYFTDAQASERVRRIRDSRAQVLLVGMGVPRQEFFIDDYGPDLGVNLIIGVGGSFDVLTGRKRRAPLWLQDLGLEWAYRMQQEPGRLSRRYAVTGLQFCVCLLRELFRLKLSHAKIRIGLNAK